MAAEEDPAGHGDGGGGDGGGDAHAPPPIGGRWSVLYAAVILNLALLIALFYIFTRAFS